MAGDNECSWLLGDPAGDDERLHMLIVTPALDGSVCVVIIGSGLTTAVRIACTVSQPASGELRYVCTGSWSGNGESCNNNGALSTAACLRSGNLDSTIGAMSDARRMEDEAAVPVDCLS